MQSIIYTRSPKNMTIESLNQSIRERLIIERTTNERLPLIIPERQFIVTDNRELVITPERQFIVTDNRELVITPERQINTTRLPIIHIAQYPTTPERQYVTPERPPIIYPRPARNGSSRSHQRIASRTNRSLFNRIPNNSRLNQPSQLNLPWFGGNIRLLNNAPEP